MNVTASYAASAWWALTEPQREYLERAVDTIVFERCQGNRALVFWLIQHARKMPQTRALSLVIWLLREKVGQDE